MRLKSEPEVKYAHDVASLSSRLYGINTGRLVSFRGIPYASISQRWKHSKKLQKLPSPFDATAFGPRAPQLNGSVLVTGGLPDPVVSDDEFKCLNLNITVPTSALIRSGSHCQRLPVMVWIHGGAFHFGSNSVSRNSPERLCDLAIAQDTPVIVVSIGYRLGPLGYAASKDLQEELGESLDCVLGNFGLVDQRHAFEWIQGHIEGFGGDASNITAFGVSAGSASIHQHIVAGDPLFDKAIMMSGTCGTLGPLPFKDYEDAWQDLVSKCGLVKHDPAQRLSALRSLDCKEVLANYSSRKALGPVADGRLLPQSWTHTQLQRASRCQSVIIGDCQVEAIIMNSLIKSLKLSSFLATVNEKLQPEIARGFCEQFGFCESMNREAFEDSCRVFLSVMMFQFPALLVAETYPGSVFYYHFDEPSPYPGPTFGIPYHGQDALFLFQNDSNSYPEDARAVAQELGSLWTKFAYGQEPWARFDAASGWRFQRFGPQGQSKIINHSSDDVRSYRYMAWLRQHFLKLRDLARIFMSMDA